MKRLGLAGGGGGGVNLAGLSPAAAGPIAAAHAWVRVRGGEG